MKTSIALLILFQLSAISCNKEGCTEVHADNYDEKAKKNDASCQYSGSFVFWYDEIASDSILATGTTKVKFYANEKLIGSIEPNVAWANAPLCESFSAMSLSVNLGSDSTKSIPYKITGNSSGLILWQGEVEYKADTCIAKRLIW
jgi:hypothetical protein